MCQEQHHEDDAMAEHEHDENNENNENKLPSPATTAADRAVETWCCGMLHRQVPQSGRDLGVWDSSLEDRSNLLSWLLLSYLTPILKLGSRKSLQPDDIGVPSAQDRAHPAYQKVLERWLVQVQQAKHLNDQRAAKFERQCSACTTDEQRDKLAQKHALLPDIEPSLAKALIQGYGTCRMLWAMIIYTVSTMLTFVPVLILKDLVSYLESGGQHVTYIHPWVQVAGLLAVPFVVSVMQTRYQVVVAHAGVFVRVSVSLLLYRKALVVSAPGRAMTSTGQVVNMMSNDTQQLQRLLMFAGMTVVAPLQIVVALYLIYLQVGNAMWAGVAFMLFLAPINGMVFGVISKLRRQVLQYSDARVKMMNEILTGIRIIKFYAWEPPFGKEVDRLRSKELQALTKLAYFIACVFSLILSSVPFIQPILVFTTYTYIQDTPLNAATAFTTIALFNIMRVPFAFLPMGLLQFLQSKIALKRVGRYLELPELASYVEHAPPPDPATSSRQKKMENLIESESFAIRSRRSLTTTRSLREIKEENNGSSQPRRNSTNGVTQNSFRASTADDLPKEYQPGSVTIRNGTFAWADPFGRTIKPVQDNTSSKDKRDSKKERRSSRKRSSIKDDDHNDDHGNGDAANGSNNHNKRVEFADKELQASVRSMISNTASEDGNSSTSATVLTLANISLTIPAGALVAVVGPVGSGKSSLLSAILGEMEPADQDSKVYIPMEGGIHREGFVSYCSQTPWVVNDTLRGNILFGREYDEERYEQVVDAAALRDDFAILPAGDMTEIGERGINLSGGQKARVSLARALYGISTKLMLLDDPLSAVDSHVGEHLFTHAISGDVCRGCTRVLVTHASHVLSRCDLVIVMEKGTIKHQGKYEDLVAKGVDFAGAIDVSKQKKSEKVAPDEVAAPHATEGTASGESATGSEIASAGSVKLDDTTDERKEAMKKSGKKLVQDEEKEEGSVSGSAYYNYAKAGGICVAFMVLVFAVLGRGSDVAGAFWLSAWAQQGFQASAQGTVLSAQDTRKFLGVYSAFAVCGLLGITLQGVCFAYLRLRASRKLHKDLTDSMLRAPIAFFDVTPIGRVLNRFAHDMDKVDLELVQSLQQALSMLCNVLGAVGAIIAATKGTFLVPMIPLGYMYYLIQKWFRKTSTELQRITSINNSPIFADFSQTLSGTPSIRAYGAGDRFTAHCEESFDKMDAAYVLVQVVSQWLALRLDCLGGLVGFFIGAYAVATQGTSFAIPAGWAGLALNYSIELTGYLKFGVRMTAQVEADMSSVERIMYYSHHIESEAPAEIPDKDPPAGTWPTQGLVEFKGASMRYRDGPLVLKNVSLKINPGEKVGICGRTGSGKSSLMITLFRISELEKDGGKIVIDGVDTAQIGTAALRLNLSIIPQDPVMFSNTIRYNLDPFGLASEEELWSVLQKVQMVEVVASLPHGLDHIVAEGGENFSLGQRQLICIARSLLRKPKILVMDEATASIDNTTDAQIQRMIRENFNEATVLTIAHRLNTIMDSDRVLVMDDGEIAEFDAPSKLMQLDDGHFRSMVEKSQKAHDAGKS